jgi:hypothetical protein
MRFLVMALTVAVLTAAPLVARAADLSGIWEVDKAAWNRQLDAMVAGMLRQMPPQMKAQMQAQGMDPAGALRAAASAGVDGTVEFLPDGRVRSATGDEGALEDGRWTLSGETLRVEVPDAEGLEALVGEVAGDRITLKPILANPDPGNAFMAEMIYPLVRRR